MMDINLIDRTIEELEKSETTFTTCRDLASLYIVRNYYKDKPSKLFDAEAELNDISPSFQKYKEIKTKYQLQEVSKEIVVCSMRNVCREISEFVIALYSSATSEERQIIVQTISELSEKVH